MMNIYIISVIDKKLSDAMTLMSSISGVCSTFYFGEHGQISRMTGKLIEFYITFFRQTGFLPRDTSYSYYRGNLQLEIDRKLPAEDNDSFSQAIIEFIWHHSYRDDELYEVFPVHLHYSTPAELRLVTGLGLSNGSPAVKLVLHELSIPKQLISFRSHRLNYLHQVIEAIEHSNESSIEALIDRLGVSNSQFTHDCKELLGSTFKQHYNKMKLINVLDDILFSRLTLKEIAYNKGFADYNAMYKGFKRTYGISLTDIPRFSFAF